jgi:hypothetical protein
MKNFFLKKKSNIKIFETYGCDASKFISNLSKNKKIGKVDDGIANNVVNHSNNTDDFFKGKNFI